MPNDRELAFVPYTDGEVTCAVATITPPDERHTHTYYDICPWSPSGRYFTCLRLPFEDRKPAPDDEADVCVIDLEERTIREVFSTTAWGFQNAAHQCWGNTDRYLYLNDKRDGVPVGVRLDLESGEATHFDGPIWHVAPDETYALSPCLIRANFTQEGYGVTVRPELLRANTEKASADDGFYRVDLSTGRTTLWLSLADLWEVIPNKDDLADKVLYAFHVKINAQGTRVLLVARAKPAEGKYYPMLLTCRPDGSALRVVLPSWRWRSKTSANHPTWHPDGERVLMNIGFEDERRFALINPDTGDIEALIDDPPGIGHPTITPDGRFLVTDDYDWHLSEGRRVAKLRLVDLVAGTWADLCKLSSHQLAEPSLRVDAHPVWGRAGKRFCFQAAPEGVRRLFVADPALPPGTPLDF